MADVKNAAKATAATTNAKPTLSESQRQGAVDRASEALEQVERLTQAMPKDHKQASLISRAASSVVEYHTSAVVAGSVADAQYASRKAVEAAAAAAWLFTQR